MSSSSSFEIYENSTCLLRDTLGRLSYNSSLSIKSLLAIVLVFSVYILLMNVAMMVGVRKTTDQLAAVHKMYFLLNIVDIVGVVFGYVGLLLPHFQSVSVLDEPSCLKLYYLFSGFVRMWYLFEPFFMVVMVIVRYVSIIHFRRNWLQRFFGKNIFIALVIVCGFIVSLAITGYRAFLTLTPKVRTISHFVYYAFVTSFSIIAVVLNLQLLKALNRKHCTMSKLGNASNQNLRHKRVTFTLLLMSTATMLCKLPEFSIQIMLMISVRNGKYSQAYDSLLDYFVLAYVLSSLGFGLNSNIFILRSKKIRKYYASAGRRIVPG